MPETKQEKKRNTLSLSYSKISIYKDCPRAFKLSYIDKVGFERRRITVAGLLAHKIFKIYTDYLVERKLPTDITAIQKITDRVLGHPSVPGDEGLILEVRELADKFARGFVLNLDTFYGAEIKLAVDSEGNQVNWKDDSVFFRGILDHVEIEDNKVKITDYKAGWVITKDTAQLETYAWLAHKIFPQIDTYLVEHYFVRYNSRRYSELSDEGIERAERRIKKFANKIANDTEFSPSPSARCSWCPYVVRCAQLPALEGLQLPVLDSEEKAREYAGKLLIVKEAIKRVEDMLKDYTRKHGPIQVGDGSYGHHFSQSPKIKDVEAFMNRMWDAGKDPLPYLNVDMRQAKKLLSELEGLEEIIENVGKTRFYFKKNKEVTEAGGSR